MKSLPLLDFSIIAVYLLGMLLVGAYFSRKNGDAEQFTSAKGTIPGWAIGISIYATFLSSNTFLGVPGKAYGGNWNSFVFSLSMPLAAWVAVKYFVPFYRTTGEVSAYTHLEHRFGSWARTYAVVCFLLTQLARMGSIFFGIALTLQALTGFSMTSVMLVVGLCIILYTVMGGIEAVIWTEVVQAVIKTFGAMLIIYVVIKDMPGGFSRIMDVGRQSDKFSLGSFSLDFKHSTFWVILLYGFFINLNNFGMDQNYVQRYHAAKTSKAASRSLWLCVWLYVPASLLFFFIGTCLFSYYNVHPDMLAVVKEQVARERLPVGAVQSQIHQLAATLQPSDYGDKVMPNFIVTRLPAGLVGLIIAAIMSAAMSTISSGMNSSATVFSEDIYRRYFNKKASEKQRLRVLYAGTVAFGLLGMITGVAMTGAKSILDMWWVLSGIFAAGMLGIFLLGILSKQTKNHAAIFAAVIGVLVIFWMTFSGQLPSSYAWLRSPFNTNMIIVIGTLSIFLAGIIYTKIQGSDNALEKI
ncbi:MAG: sodium:solute symporter [Bacteroidota bacterium]|nr:sodium:solute symporter [Bacteroidota bacterium]MDP4212368.1 sodium:solute symporter [Bacteroidota bacterium]MDP4250814.1 sodium:solute symporter [Bacteroidota bacterium]